MNPSLSNRPSVGNRLDLLVVFVLVAAGLAIYGQTLGHPFISFDDPGYVSENPHVLHGLTREGWHWAWTSFERSNWHPLTWLSLMLDGQLYGLNAGGYHLTNLLLHVADAVLLFYWLRTATRARWPSAWVALFFVVHPLHVESVAWVTERKDVLSTFFLLLTLLAYTRYARGGSWHFYTLALALFALGLTAKPMLVTLPLLTLLLDFWPLRRTAGWRWLAVEKLPFFALVLTSCAVTFLAQRSTAVVPLETLPVGHRLASAMLGYGFYLRKTFWPLDLGVYYPYWRAQWVWSPWAWGGALAAATAGATWHARRLPWLFVGWCWFLGTLVPVIGVVQVGGQAVADRYVYVPHIGLFVALFWTLAAAVRRWPQTGPWLGVAGVAGAAGCVALSWQQAGYWRSSVTLFEHTAKIVRPTGRLYNLLGDALVEEGRYADAEGVYRRAWDAGSHDAAQATSLSGTMLRRGAWTEVAALLEPLAQQPATATDGVLNNLAAALVKLDRRDEAVAVYGRCTQRYPDYPLAHFGLGELLLARGDTVNAMGEYEAGLAAQDDWLPALTRLAWFYALSTNSELHERALALARHAVSVSGGHDLASLEAQAAAAASLSRWPEAVQAAQAADDLAHRPGAPPGAEDRCQMRLERYRQGQGPAF